MQAEMLENYLERICVWARGRTFSEEEAEELAQEIIYQAVAGLARLRDESRFEPWLWGVASNCAKAFRRRKGKERALFLYDVPENLLTEAEIRKRLDEGYKPGSTTQIASSQMQYCISRIQQAIDARWREVMPRIGAEGTVVILARVNAQGRLVNCRLKDSCGDRTSDAAALTVVKTVPAISGLDREFLKKYAKEDLAIRYKVRER